MVLHEDPKQAVRDACALVGGTAALARFLGITSAAVSQWMSGIRRVPAEHCPKIERATGGRVVCESLRNDIDWAAIRCPHPQSQRRHREK